MNLPKRFKLGGRTWTVTTGHKSKKWFGKTSGSNCTIKLSKMCQDHDTLWHTYWHELIHAICYTMGWARLNDDEIKVDAMASLLKQAWETSKYGAHKKARARRASSRHKAKRSKMANGGR